MKIETRTTQEITISDDKGFRVASVNLTDEAPGKGRLTVVCDGMSYSCYWNSMGDHSALEFFKLCATDYVVNCLDPFGTLFRKIDPQILKGIIADDISKASQFDDAKKVELVGRLGELSPISDVNGLVALNGALMTEIYGPMWVNQVNERFLGQHPTYRGLSERIETIRSALVG